MGVPTEYETQLRYFAREVEGARRYWYRRLNLRAVGLWLALVGASVLLGLPWFFVTWMLIAAIYLLGRFVPVPARARRRFVALTAIGASPYMRDVLLLHWHGYLYRPLVLPPHLPCNPAEENILDTLEQMMRP